MKDFHKDVEMYLKEIVDAHPHLSEAVEDAREKLPHTTNRTDAESLLYAVEALVDQE